MHRKFVGKMEEFSEKFQAGKVAVNMQVMEFLKDWLIKHIQGEDKKYGEYILRQEKRSYSASGTQKYVPDTGRGNGTRAVMPAAAVIPFDDEDMDNF